MFNIVDYPTSQNYSHLDLFSKKGNHLRLCDHILNVSPTSSDDKLGDSISIDLNDPSCEERSTLPFLDSSQTNEG